MLIVHKSKNFLWKCQSFYALKTYQANYVTWLSIQSVLWWEAILFLLFDSLTKLFWISKGKLYLASKKEKSLWMRNILFSICIIEITSPLSLSIFCKSLNCWNCPEKLIFKPKESSFWRLLWKRPSNQQKMKRWLSIFWVNSC